MGYINKNANVIYTNSKNKKIQYVMIKPKQPLQKQKPAASSIRKPSLPIHRASSAQSNHLSDQSCMSDRIPYHQNINLSINQEKEREKRFVPVAVPVPIRDHGYEYQGHEQGRIAQGASYPTSSGDRLYDNYLNNYNLSASHNPYYNAGTNENTYMAISTNNYILHTNTNTIGNSNATSNQNTNPNSSNRTYRNLNPSNNLNSNYNSNKNVVATNNSRQNYSYVSKKVNTGSNNSQKAHHMSYNQQLQLNNTFEHQSDKFDQKLHSQSLYLDQKEEQSIKYKNKDKGRTLNGADSAQIKIRNKLSIAHLPGSVPQKQKPRESSQPQHSNQQQGASVKKPTDQYLTAFQWLIILRHCFHSKRKQKLYLHIKKQILINFIRTRTYPDSLWSKILVTENQIKFSTSDIVAQIQLEGRQKFTIDDIFLAVSKGYWNKLVPNIQPSKINKSTTVPSTPPSTCQAVPITLNPPMALVPATPTQISNLDPSLNLNSNPNPHPNLQISIPIPHTHPLNTQSQQQSQSAAQTARFTENMKNCGLENRQININHIYSQNHLNKDHKQHKQHNKSHTSLLSNPMKPNPRNTQSYQSQPRFIQKNYSSVNNIIAFASAKNSDREKNKDKEKQKQKQKQKNKDKTKNKNTFIDKLLIDKYIQKQRAKKLSKQQEYEQKERGYSSDKQQIQQNYLQKQEQKQRYQQRYQQLGPQPQPHMPITLPLQTLKQKSKSKSKYKKIQKISQGKNSSGKGSVNVSSSNKIIDKNIDKYISKDKELDKNLEKYLRKDRKVQVGGLGDLNKEQGFCDNERDRSVRSGRDSTNDKVTTKNLMTPIYKQKPLRQPQDLQQYTIQQNNNLQQQFINRQKKQKQSPSSLHQPPLAIFINSPTGQLQQPTKPSTQNPQPYPYPYQPSQNPPSSLPQIVLTSPLCLSTSIPTPNYIPKTLQPMSITSVNTFALSQKQLKLSISPISYIDQTHNNISFSIEDSELPLLSNNQLEYQDDRGNRSGIDNVDQQESMYANLHQANRQQSSQAHPIISICSHSEPQPLNPTPTTQTPTNPVNCQASYSQYICSISTEQTDRFEYGQSTILKYKNKLLEGKIVGSTIISKTGATGQLNLSAVDSDFQERMLLVAFLEEVLNFSVYKHKDRDFGKVRQFSVNCPNVGNAVSQYVPGNYVNVYGYSSNYASSGTDTNKPYKPTQKKYSQPISSIPQSPSPLMLSPNSQTAPSPSHLAHTTQLFYGLKLQTRKNISKLSPQILQKLFSSKSFIQYFSNLQALKISEYYNQLSITLPVLVDNMNLRILNLMNNNIGGLGLLKEVYLGKLEFINISHNHIQNISQLLNYQQLVQIHAKNNQIDHISLPTEHAQSKKLKIIDLAYNRIHKQQDLWALAKVKSLQMINLMGNKIMVGFKSIELLKKQIICQHHQMYIFSGYTQYKDLAFQARNKDRDKQKEIYIDKQKDKQKEAQKLYSQQNESQN